MAQLRQDDRPATAPASPRTHGWLVALAVIGGAALWLAATGQRPPPDPGDEAWARQRQRMVETQLAARDVDDKRVLATMGKVPRHAFVPDAVRGRAYDDSALPLGHGQTISQPYIVALMTQAAAVQPKHRVLEVGTGSGYQAAVLSELVAEVYTIELVPELAKEAAERLKRLGYANVTAKAGDGYLGWPDAAPFDAVLVTCGADHVPKPLMEQLKPGGKMVIPVGRPPHDLTLRVLTKNADGTHTTKDLAPVAFVPLRRATEGGAKK
jgi:protein-L-isoaspartate(D-aspartate) O-methyltransferase